MSLFQPLDSLPFLRCLFHVIFCFIYLSHPVFFLKNFSEIVNIDSLLINNYQRQLKKNKQGNDWNKETRQILRIPFKRPQKVGCTTCNWENDLPTWTGWIEGHVTGKQLVCCVLEKKRKTSYIYFYVYIYGESSRNVWSRVHINLWKQCNIRDIEQHWRLKYFKDSTRPHKASNQHPSRDCNIMEELSITKNKWPISAPKKLTE